MLNYSVLVINARILHPGILLHTLLLLSSLLGSII